MSPSNLQIQLPLAFGNGRARLDRDPDHLAMVVSRAVPLRCLAPRRSIKQFVHWSAHVQAGPLGITAAAHSPLHGANHAHAKAVFTLPTMGEKRFLIQGRTHRARAGYSALFLPGEAYCLDTTTCSGVMFMLCPHELAALAATMAGGPRSSLRFAPIQQPLELLESQPQQGKILALLRRSLQLIDLAMLNGPMLPRQLGLDDKLQRLMALLLYPQLTASSAAGALQIGKPEQQSFRDLVDEMQQDPLVAWSLTRMETKAGLSHDQLLQLFHQTFSCGPLDWLRLQRLCWARQRLDAGEPISLGQLALQCGYVDLRSFQHDFEHQFQMAPELIQSPLTF